MQFTSLSFLFVFLPILLVLYYVCKPEIRKVVLLLFSLLFYSFGSPTYMLSLCVMTLLNIFLAILIQTFRDRNVVLARIFLIIGIICDVGVLVGYKCIDFILPLSNRIFDISYETGNILIPLGISFFTFKAVSFIADVYRKKTESVSFIDAANYLSFFAQIQSGPIQRYNSFANERDFSGTLLATGVTRFMAGFAKKIILADVLSKIVSEIFDSTLVMSTGLAWLGSVCFSLQLYYDFSGYSDMAIGIGNMLGIECEPNFNFPYCTKSVSEFWRRWHISLGSWFKDYVYIPMGGSRVKPYRVYINLLVVWFLTGLWHGTGLSFIAWGLGYFVVISLEKGLNFPGRFKSKITGNIYRIFVLLFINFQWVLFRSSGLKAGLRYIKDMVIFKHETIPALRAWFLLKDYGVFILLAVIFATPIAEFAKEKCEKNVKAQRIYDVITGVFISVAFILAVTFVICGQHSPFLYGNF